MERYLTKPQLQIYDAQQFYGSSINNLCGSILLKGIPDQVYVRKAVEDILQANDIFRIRLSLQGSVPLQQFTANKNVRVAAHTFSAKEDMEQFAEQLAKKPLELSSKLGEIYEVTIGTEYFGIVLLCSHFIADAWSLSFLCTQFAKRYAAYERGSREAFYCGSYEKYCLKEEAGRQHQRNQRAENYWKNIIKKQMLPVFLIDKTAKHLKAARETFVIPGEMVERYRAWCMAQQISLFALFSTALACYISRCRDSADRFFLGTAVLNRFGKEEKNTAGMFVNTVPVPVSIREEETFAENARRFAQTSLDVFKYQKYQYRDILRLVRQEDPQAAKLFDVTVSYQNAVIGACDIPCETTWYSCGMQAETLQYHIDDRDQTGTLTFHYDYQVEKLEKERIHFLHDSLLQIIDNAIKSPDRLLKEINILGKEEEALLSQWNQTVCDLPDKATVISLFEDEVKRHPQRKAVIAKGETLTYEELQQRSDLLAAALLAQGIRKGEIVAIRLPRTGSLLVAMLGILKAGAVYLPIDTTLPEERIRLMLDDSKAVLCLTEQNIEKYLGLGEDLLSENLLSEDLSSEYLSFEKSILGNLSLDKMLAKGSLYESLSLIKSSLNREDGCYCLYTSGSTGKPKAVLVKHGNVLNFISDNERNIIFHEIKRSGCQTIVSVTSVGFDIFLTESLAAVVMGLTVILADEEQTRSQRLLNELLCDYPAHVIGTTPTKMGLLMQDTQYNAFLKNLKVIILGGEPLKPELLKKLQKWTAARIYNAYGPTETTVCSTETLAEEWIQLSDIHIGKPIANTQVYIVDQAFRQCPVGVAGELCIGGAGVSAGYLGKKELTDERFPDNPFGGGKLYRTGDVAYWRFDGNLVFVGRKDFQVKIRGQRIEPGEIESILCGLEKITQAVVQLGKDRKGEESLFGFYSGKSYDSEELRTILRKQLPDYMCPRVLMHLEKMPVSQNGKIDRQALASLAEDYIAEEPQTPYVQPQTEWQAVLCRNAEELLDRDRIGLEDDLFECGMDSLKAIGFAAEAYARGIRFDIQNIYDYPTIGKLCAYIESQDKSFVNYDEKEFEQIHQLLQEGMLQGDTLPEEERKKETVRQELHAILLTGATGFLGAHILFEYLEKHTGTAYCLVREENGKTADERLKEVLQYYFGNEFPERFGHRIVVLRGDVTQEAFGLEKLPAFDLLINAAGSVKHYGSYTFFRKWNVESVQNAIALVKKQKAGLLHISTLSVSGVGLTDIFYHRMEKEKPTVDFSEETLYVGQPLDNVYIRSKFEAERVIYEEILKGLPAKVIRVGNLTNRRNDLRFQKNYADNAFLQRVRSILELGMLPSYMKQVRCEFSPVDEVAAAVMKIADHYQIGEIVFHVSSDREVALEEICAFAARNGIRLRMVGQREFDQQLETLKRDTEKKYIYDTLAKDMDEEGKLQYTSRIRVHKEKTLDVLEKLGFSWSVIDDAYLEGYIRYFREIGFWDV